MQQKFVHLATALCVALATMAGVITPALAVENPLVISAVQITGGVGKTSEDFIELFNPNPDPVNLNGYRLVKRTATSSLDSSIKSWTTDTFIPAHSFYLWTNSTFTGISSVPDATTSSTLADNNGVGLRLGALDTGELIDSLSWGTTTNGFVSSGLDNPAAGESVVRNSLFEAQGYSLALSSPRNSTVQFLPSTPIDNSTCSSSVTNQTSLAGATSNVDLVFTNTGTTSWTSEGYSIKGSDSDYSLQNGLSVAPSQLLQQSVSVVAPELDGLYHYQWQMANSGVVFGASCGFDLTVQSPAPTPTGGGTGDSGDSGDNNPPPAISPSTIRITEILPNPQGKDSGREVVELFNYGTEVVDLSGWILDDVAPDQALSSDAFTLASVEVGAGEYIAITIPAGKFTLNNSKGDVLTIFDPDGQKIDSVKYIDNAPSSKSYSLINGQWSWVFPTLGSANIIASEQGDDSDLNDESLTGNFDGLEISEIYPSPSVGQSEFIELFSSTDQDLDLSGLQIVMGSKTASLPKILLTANSYIAIYGKDLPVKLSDQGKSINLVKKDGTVISSIEYPEAHKGQSYSKFEDKFLWTLAVTPGQENQLVQTSPSLLGPTQKDLTSSSKVKTTTTKTVKTVSKTSVTPKTVSKTSSAKISSPQTKPANPDKSEENKSSGPAGAVAIALASLGAGVLAVYRFGFGGALPF